MFTRVKRVSMIAVSAIAITALVGACSASGGREGTGADEGSEGAGTPEIRVSLITHAPPGDTFWDIVRKGAEENAAKNNVDLQYTSDPDGARQAQLVNQAVDQGVDGIIVTLAKADAMSSAVGQAVDAGIPVISVNAGEEDFRELGALTHFGQNDRLAGEAIAERMQEEGISNPICVIQEQGHVGLEARCEGVSNVLPDTEVLYVQGTDMPSVKSTVTSSLQSSDADAIIGGGAPVSITIAEAAEEVGADILIGSFDLNPELAEAISDGRVFCTVDQQPYLQGYQAVDALWSYYRGGLVVGGGQQVFTGPAIVDSSNIEDVLTFAQDGVR